MNLSTRRPWLETLLARNADCAYLRSFGSPRSWQAFRAEVPLCHYEDLAPWLRRIVDGQSGILFAGRPLAFERTGGSSGGAKLLPYSAEGLRDFRRNLAPWVRRVLLDNKIRGRIYLATSPAAREAETLGGVPVGLPDGVYLGETLGRRLAGRSVLTPDIARETNFERWRQKTVAALRAADELELISVWSPTFLLRLLDDIPDPERCWPRLKLVSCWMSGASRPYAEALMRRLPQARFEAKGLMSTEAVVSVPDAGGCAVLAPHGFIEFLPEGATEPLLPGEISAGASYEVVVTTASGLYRYRNGDRVRVTGWVDGRPALEFIGRSLVCDLVGEKLEDAFVARCLQALDRDALLVPDFRHPGYALIGDVSPPAVAETERRLCANPQYAYARAIGQLQPLRSIAHPHPNARAEEILLQRGASPGALKAMALRPEAFWLEAFTETGA